jgi:phospholipid-translocating ATPase
VLPQVLLDLEINKLAKVSPVYNHRIHVSFYSLLYTQILCAVTFALSIVLVAMNGFRGFWYIYVFRFLILFSSIIPIRYGEDYLTVFRFTLTKNQCSLRVNLDMGKTVYAQQIMNDNEILNTIVQTSTLPEELGCIEYLLSNKTGTLTQNGKAR